MAGKFNEACVGCVIVWYVYDGKVDGSLVVLEMYLFVFRMRREYGNCNEP